jgi:hypothetical protein
MKKMLILLLAVVMTLSLAACAAKNDTAGSEAAESDGQNPVMNFVGTYGCDRATMIVECKDADAAQFTVIWSGSAATHSEWTMSGKLDTDKLTVDYTDCVKKEVTFNEDGSVASEDVIYEDGTGTISCSADEYVLTWDDAKEHAAEGMIFVGGGVTEETDYSAVTAMSASEVEAFAAFLKGAYLNEEWDVIAEYVQYPVNVNGVAVENEAALLEKLNNMHVNDAAFSAMTQETCTNLFFNGDGICVGAGDLWLLDPNYMTDETPVLNIIAINGVE